MKQISLDELNERISTALGERNLLQTKTKGEDEWQVVQIVPNEFAGAIEKVIRDCLTLQ